MRNGSTSVGEAKQAATMTFWPSAASAGTVTLPDQVPSALTWNSSSIVNTPCWRSRSLKSTTSTSGLGAPWGGTHGVIDLTAITVWTGPDAGRRSNTPVCGSVPPGVGVVVVGDEGAGVDDEVVVDDEGAGVDDEGAGVDDEVVVDDEGAGVDDEVVVDDEGAGVDDEVVVDDAGAGVDDEVVVDDEGAGVDDEVVVSSATAAWTRPSCKTSAPSSAIRNLRTGSPWGDIGLLRRCHVPEHPRWSGLGAFAPSGLYQSDTTVINASGFRPLR